MIHGKGHVEKLHEFMHWLKSKACKRFRNCSFNDKIKTAVHANRSSSLELKKKPSNIYKAH